METLLEKKYSDESWDFREANTKPLTHGFHVYPAMMIPQIAARLIEKYGSAARLLFDPYCGTGTSLVEANVHGINAIGTDLNPLARLIAKAKTTPIPLEALDAVLKEFQDFRLSVEFAQIREEEVEVPRFTNIDFWFTQKVQRRLALIRNFILEIKDEAIRRFFYVAFSETVRESSLTRNSEFKLYRMPESKRKTFDPDVYAIMSQKLSRNRQGLLEFMDLKAGQSKTEIYDFDTVEGVPDNILSEKSVDLIVTSPPYGDSRTTVAYGQFSRLANQWLGFHEAARLDNELMGGKRPTEITDFGIDVLDRILEQIGQRDAKRVRDVYAFYKDYFSSINHIAPLVKKGGFVCFVVGNRRVKGITLPTDEITVKMFERNGFTHVETIMRRIPNKRMPSKNSPSNVIGQKDSTMNFEYIVVLQKL